ncbi:MAG: hypothetical protein U9R37_02950 [Campylobacterota bacterium]|nr:hypothetical protein [Campylobacterota bacterium]
MTNIKKLVIGLFVAGLLVGCGGGSDDGSTETYVCTNDDFVGAEELCTVGFIGLNEVDKECCQLWLQNN